MRADEYPVTFDYKETDNVYYYQPTARRPKTSLWLFYYHRGRDRHCLNAPLYIGGVLAGKTGATGRVSGPHLHTGAFKDGVDIHPGPYEFKPGLVTAVGQDSVNGKYIKVQMQGGVIVNYLHLSEVYIKVNDRLDQGGAMSRLDTTDEEWSEMHFAYTGEHAPNPRAGNPHKNLSETINLLKNLPQAKEFRRRAAAYGFLEEEIGKRDRGIDDLRTEIRKQEDMIKELKRSNPEAAQRLIELSQLLEQAARIAKGS